MTNFVYPSAETLPIGHYFRTSSYEPWHEVVSVVGNLCVLASEGGLTYHRLYSTDTVEVSETKPETPTFDDDLFHSWRGAYSLCDVPKSKYGSIKERAEAVLLQPKEAYNEAASKTIILSVLRQVNVSYKLSITIPVTVRMFDPSPVEGSSNVSMYLNHKDRLRDRKTTMKIGRALKHMLPMLNDQAIASVAEPWIESRKPRELILKVGKTGPNFRKAYKGIRAKFRNPLVTHSRKSLANSCMHTVQVEGFSPAEAYASGDFAVAWVETKDGHVAGRVVYSDKEDLDHTHAPLYGACEQSLDMLAAHLDEIESKPADESDWRGLRLVNLNGSLDQAIAPYSDLGSVGTVDTDFITLDRSGDASFESTDGYVTGGGCYCAMCSDSMDENESFYCEDYGDICEHCFNEHYVFSEDGEAIRREDAIEVWHTYKSFYNNSLHSTSTYEHETYNDAVWCECVSEYWNPDYVTESSNSEGEWVPTHLVEDFPELFTNDDDDDNNNSEEDQAA